MGNFLETMVRGLAELQNNPFALIGYVVLVVLFIYFSIRRITLISTMSRIDSLPESQRLDMIKVIYGAHLKDGMTSNEYINNQKNLYYFIFSMTIVFAALIAFIVGYSATPASAAEIEFEDFCQALNVIQRDAPNKFRNIQSDNVVENSDGSKSRESAILLPKSMYNYVDEDNKDISAQFIATFYADTSRKEAERIFGEKTQMLNRCLGDWMPHNDAFDEEKLLDRYISFVKGNKKVILSLDDGGDDNDTSAAKEQLFMVNIMILTV